MSLSIKEQFLRDVAKHEIAIQLDHGAFRHMVFKRPNTISRMFSLTTTPGRLVFGGDMGCFVFERTHDMFAFFRRDMTRFEPNFGYWHEKLVAVDRGGSTRPSPAKFREHLEEYLEKERDLTEAEIAEIREFIDEVVEEFDNDGPEHAYSSVGDFSLDSETKGCRKQFFDDFWERNSNEYTIHYLWACHAIQWGVAQYDAHKQRLHTNTIPITEPMGGAE